MASSKPKQCHDSSGKLRDYIGPAVAMNPTEVPTFRAVIQQGLLLKEKKLLEEDLSKTSYTKKELASDLAPLVLAQWTKTNYRFIPPVVIKENTLVKKIEKLWQTAEDFAWGRKTKGEEAFLEKIDKLLDITLCQHPILLCQAGVNIMMTHHRMRL